MLFLCYVIERKHYQHDGRQRHFSADSSYSTGTSEAYDSDDAPKKAKILKSRAQSSYVTSRSAEERYTRNENIWKRQDKRNDSEYSEKHSGLPLSNNQNILNSDMITRTLEEHLSRVTN